jgi:MFS family permease
MVIGGFTYSFYVSTFILPALKSEEPTNTAWYLNKSFISTLILVSAGINGFGAALLWVASGNYIAECATDSNKGLFNSIFWCFLMFSSIIGNLMAAYVIVGVK